MFLELSLWKGVLLFERKGKLSLRYIGPYKTLERVGPVAYRSTLTMDLTKIHNVFYAYVLRKYIPYLTHVLEVQPIQLKGDLSYEESVQILDEKEQVLRNKTIPLVKVLWRNHGVEESTWESND